MVNQNHIERLEACVERRKADVLTGNNFIPGSDRRKWDKHQEHLVKRCQDKINILKKHKKRRVKFISRFSTDYILINH